MIHTRSSITTPQAPAAIGPYSQAVVAGGLVYTSGQIALDPATAQLVAGSIEEQTHRVFANLKAVLEAAGSSLEQVVKTTVFLKSMDDFAAMNAVYEQHIRENGAGDSNVGAAAPARSTVAVAGLPRNALVEIEAVALVIQSAGEGT